MKRTVALLLTLGLGAGPAIAQERPLAAAIEQAGTAGAAGQAAGSTRANKAFWAGIILAGTGAAIATLGATVAKSGDTTSGNTPESAYAACDAQKANPVYAGNRCDLLKGPHSGMLWGGVAVAAAGLTLALVKAPGGSLEIGVGHVTYRHRVRF